MPLGRLRDLFSTLRFRLLVWVTVVVMVMVAVTMVTVRVVMRRAVLADFNRLLMEEADGVALAVKKEYPDINVLAESMQNNVDALARREWFREWFIEIYTAENRKRILASHNVPTRLAPFAVDPQLDEPFDMDGYRIVVRRVTARAGTVLYTRCGCSRRPVEEDLEQADRIMVMSALVTLLLAPLGGYTLAGRATRPIAKIIATAANLQPSKLDERLPIRGTGDELDQLSLTINGMLDRIASYIERNRDFVANAAHELRSPLAAIRSTVEVALNRDRTAEEYATLLTDVMEECTRLGGLVNRLLLLAEGDAGRLGARDQSVRLDKVVRESVDMFEGVAETQGVRLHANDLPLVAVPGEEQHVRQVVRNLIDNAIKFCPAPGEVQISLGVQPEQRRVWLRVRDTGVGIATEDLPRIFERFYRADKARTRAARPGGHGLGLSICQSIVTALKGEITVESQPGRGSIFTVWLPMAQDSQSVPGNEATAPAA